MLSHAVLNNHVKHLSRHTCSSVQHISSLQQQGCGSDRSIRLYSILLYPQAFVQNRL